MGNALTQKSLPGKDVVNVQRIQIARYGNKMIQVCLGYCFFTEAFWPMARSSKEVS